METTTQKMNDNGSEIYKALIRGPDLLIRSEHSGCNKAELWYRILPFELQITTIMDQGERIRLDPSTETVSKNNEQIDGKQRSLTSAAEESACAMSFCKSAVFFSRSFFRASIFLNSARSNSSSSIFTQNVLSEIKGSGFGSGFPRIHIVALFHPDPDPIAKKLKKANYMILIPLLQKASVHA